MTKQKRKTAGKYLKHSSRYGLHEWDIEADEEGSAFVKAVLKQAISEAMDLGSEHAILHDDIYKAREAFIKATLKQGLEHALGYETYACIADDLSDTPLKMFVDLPLGDADGANPTWAIDFPDIIESFFYNHTDQSEEKFEPESVPLAIAIRDALRELADKLDKALP